MAGEACKGEVIATTSLRITPQTSSPAQGRIFGLGKCSSRAAPATGNANQFSLTSPFQKAEVDEIRTAVGEGFTHIVLLGTRDWKSIANGLEFDCRVHTLRIQVDYHSMAWEDVRAALREVVDLDTEWKVRVAPSDLRHQLLLPPTFFSTDRQTRNFWKFCDVYSKGQIESAAELLRLVDRVHRKRSDGERVWVDARRLEYSVDPSLHSRANEERGGGALYRFCFPLPQGFHF